MKKTNATSRTLRFENLEQRQLLSASTIGDVATIQTLTTLEAAPLADAPLDLTAALATETENLATNADGDVYTVTSAADDDSEGTLRWAISQIGSGTGTVAFDANLRGQTISFSSYPARGEIKIAENANVTIDASNLLNDKHEPGVTIDAIKQSRIFNVERGATLTIDGVRLTGGNAVVVSEDITYHGKSYKYWEGDVLDITDPYLSLSDEVVGGDTLDNYIDENASYGGAIGVSRDATLNVKNSVFEDNWSWYGGAIGLAKTVGGHSNVKITIDSSTFVDNTALAGGGAIGESASNTQALLSIANSVFDGNEVAYTTGNSKMYYGAGGAIFVRGAETTATNCTFVNNLATRYRSWGASQSQYHVGNVVYSDVDFYLYNSIVVDNGGADDSAFAGANLNLTIDHSLLDNTSIHRTWNNSGGTKENYTPSSEGEVIVYDPNVELFVDAANKNYKPAFVENSQIVNAGDNAYVEGYAVDRAGLDRVVYETVDVGAYEQTLKIVVTTLEDVVDPLDAWISLREAVEYYYPIYHDLLKTNTVAFAPWLDGGTITLDDGAVTISDSMTIDATNLTNGITVSGDDVSRVFVATGEDETLDVTIKGLTIANGKTASQENGAGIYADNANLTIENAKFNDNASGYDGGAIYLNSGSLTVTSATFDGNAADHAGGAIAVYTADATSATDVSATITDSTFTNNEASRGGAAYVKLGEMTISGSTFTHNDAELFLGTNYGGALYYGSARGSVANSTFENNWSKKDGGAIYAYDSALVVYGTFTGNAATRGAAYFQSKGTTTISGGEFSGNTASDQGGALFVGNGAIATISDGAKFENNDGANQGGAISIEKSEATIENASFATNSANLGGAIYQNGGCVTATSAEFSENQTTQSGGAVYADKGVATFNDSTFEENVAGGYGGAIYVGSTAEVTLEGGSLANNESTKAGGAVFVFGAKLTTSDGTTFDTNTSGTYGGAVAVSAQGEAELVDVVLTNNTTNGKLGGAVYSIDSSATLKVFTATGNTAKSGAAIYGYNSSIVAINGTVSGNEATETTGGAIAVSASTLTVTSGTYASNSAKTLGGAIMAYDSTAMISGASFTGNGADSGAAVAATGGDALYVYDSTFDENVATTNGGAIYVSDVDLTVSGTTFTGNEASAAAGVYVRKGDVQLSKSVFTGNTATNYGAGLYLADSLATATVDNCLFAENNAEKGGSGLYSSYAKFTLENCTVAGNEGASAVRSLNSDATIVNSIIARNDGVDVFLRGDVTANYVLSAFTDWTSGDDNIEDDDSELFAEGGYELVAGSLAVDAGDNSAVTTGSDLAGATRIVNGVVDLGAYELQTSSEAVLDEAFADLFEENFVEL